MTVETQIISELLEETSELLTRLKCSCAFRQGILNKKTVCDKCQRMIDLTKKLDSWIKILDDQKSESGLVKTGSV